MFHFTEVWELVMWVQLEWAAMRDSSLRAVTLYRGITA